VNREHRTLKRGSVCLAALSGALLAASLAHAGATVEDIEPAVTHVDETAAAADDSVLASPLIDTAWRLVEFRSMDDAIGVIQPDDPSLYTMLLSGDGTVTMRLNCNRATGTWRAEPSKDGSSGHFEFGSLAATLALCPPPSMDGRITADSEFVRSYLLKDGRLHLSLMADGGIYTWDPDGSEQPGVGVYVASEDGGPRNWEVVESVSSLILREGPSVSARTTDSYTPGTIPDNLGCISVEGRVWCDVQQLGGGPRGYVAAVFLKPAVSPDGTVAMGPDDSALRA